eukprot:gnl/Spiro4/17910_TR9543_c0_g1_i1.p1 gnl/Spiro4/17910_TR9543_c0_g1~~gnl/Spiro4/17910_TR9543_c0_g1_i1.p1  ORF type:complete len:134 (-),score=11.97 gnl/Spiro4/17910_TR9543_c0_g1_i1:147-548(-)
MRILLTFLLLWQAPVEFKLPPKADRVQAEVKTSGQQHVPKSGTFTVPLFDKDHPLGYVSRPGCWAKQIGKQTIFHFDNDAHQITVTAPAHSLIYWECHGFMYKNAYETCMDAAAKHRSAEEAKLCGPPPSELH